MELPTSVSRMLSHHQGRKHHLHRRRVCQRVSPFLADIDTDSFQQIDQLRDRSIGSSQNSDAGVGRETMNPRNELRGVFKAGDVLVTSLALDLAAGLNADEAGQ